MVKDLPKAAVCVPILPKINRKETQNNWYVGYSGAWIRLKKMQFPGGVPLRLPIARTVMLLFSFLQPVKPWGTFLTRRKADLSFNFFRLLKKWSILTIDHCKKTRTFYVILISSVELVKKICGILDHYITLKCTNEKN